MPSHLLPTPRCTPTYHALGPLPPNVPVGPTQFWTGGRLVYSFSSIGWLFITLERELTHIPLPPLTCLKNDGCLHQPTAHTHRWRSPPPPLRFLLAGSATPHGPTPTHYPHAVHDSGLRPPPQRCRFGYTLITGPTHQVWVVPKTVAVVVARAARAHCKHAHYHPARPFTKHHVPAPGCYAAAWFFGGLLFWTIPSVHASIYRARYGGRVRPPTTTGITRLVQPLHFDMRYPAPHLPLYLRTGPPRLPPHYYLPDGCGTRTAPGCSNTTVTTRYANLFKQL